MCFGQNAFIGTWKLKEAKSEFSPGAPKNRTVVDESEADKVKVTVDSVGGDGKPTHYVWVGKFDGKEYPVIGDPLSDARSYTVVDEHILGFNVMKDRKVITSGRIVVSEDGKSRTVTMTGTNAQGHSRLHQSDAEHPPTHPHAVLEPRYLARNRNAFAVRAMSDHERRSTRLWGFGINPALNMTTVALKEYCTDHARSPAC